MPLDSIKMIGVPTDKIEYVKQFIKNDDIKVLGVDGIEERFYCLDSIQMDIYYDDYNKLKESLNTYDDINRMLKEQSSNNDNISKRGDKLASK